MHIFTNLDNFKHLQSKKELFTKLFSVDYIKVYKWISGYQEGCGQIHMNYNRLWDVSNP